MIKIRKLILESKLQEIEKQYPYLFVFHCSGLTFEEWRNWKNVLYPMGAKVFFQPGIQKAFTLPLSSGSHWSRGDQSVKTLKRLKREENDQTNISEIEISLDKTTSVPKIKKNHSHLFQSNFSKLSGPYCVFFFKSENDITKTLPIQLSNWNKARPTGAKIEEKKGSQTKLVLLYARLNRIIVNHVDIKEALDLKTNEVYQNLFLSLRHIVSILDNICLHHKNSFYLLVQSKSNEKTNDSLFTKVS